MKFSSRPFLLSKAALLPLLPLPSMMQAVKLSTDSSYGLGAIPIAPRCLCLKSYESYRTALCPNWEGNIRHNLGKWTLCRLSYWTQVSPRDGSLATSPFAQYQVPKQTSNQGTAFPDVYDAILRHLTYTGEKPVYQWHTIQCTYRHCHPWALATCHVLILDICLMNTTTCITIPRRHVS